MNELLTAHNIIFGLEAKLLYDVCGPTAKYLDKHVAGYTEAGVKNLERVFTNALRRLNAADKHEGAIPPRVLKDVVNEAYFCENELEAEYLGGLLASSKAPSGRDDRAVSYCAVLSSLSTYQIRAHYILYSSILQWDKNPLSELMKWMSRRMGITVALVDKDFRRDMDFSADEPQDAVLQHVFTGLERNGLSEKGFSVVQPDERMLKDDIPAFRYFYPTLAGIELFLWGLGVGDKGLNAYTRELLQNESLPNTLRPLDLQLARVSWD